MFGDSLHGKFNLFLTVNQGFWNKSDGWGSEGRAFSKYISTGRSLSSDLAFLRNTLGTGNVCEQILHS